MGPERDSLEGQGFLRSRGMFWRGMEGVLTIMFCVVSAVTNLFLFEEIHQSSHVFNSFGKWILEFVYDLISNKFCE